MKFRRFTFQIAILILYMNQGTQISIQLNLKKTDMTNNTINCNCYIELAILEANFLKDDGDAFGKQDPFVQFVHNGQVFKTKTHEDAGKHAKFDDVFRLDNLDKSISNNEQLTLEAYDEDACSSDLLAKAKPLPYSKFIENANKKSIMKIDIFDKKNKRAGDLLFEYQYFFVEADKAAVIRDVKAKPLNKKCKVELFIVEAKFLKDADTFGKQDPFITFKYGNGTRSTKVAEDAGKHAIFNETFVLKNVMAEIDKNANLVLEAMEKDVGSSEFLGSIVPISWSDICSKEGTQKFDVVLNDSKGKKAGNVVFKTNFVWEEYSLPQASEILDERSVMHVVIKEATFLKDADTFGKQDPFIKFKYRDFDLQTDVKDDAGKQAKWDELFQLTQIFEEYKKDSAITFEAYDKDVGGSDLLGCTDPIDIVDIVQNESINEHKMDIYDTQGNLAGTIKLTTQLIKVLPDPPLLEKVNDNCQLEVKMISAEFLKDEGDAMGKQDPFLAFTYDFKEYKTAVKDDAGKKASFDDVFILDQVDGEARSGETLVIQAFDHDVGSRELLGEANPITVQQLCSTEDKQHFKVDIFCKFKKTGHIVFETQLIYHAPDPPPMPVEQPLNKKCKVELTIIEAMFFKDADTFGKQDPYITFKFGRGTKSTTVAEDAGKHAIFNEKFVLTNVMAEIKKGSSLVLDAMEKDVASSDHLGSTQPINWNDICAFSGIIKRKVDIIDEKGIKAGKLRFITEFFWEEYVVPEPSDKFDQKSLVLLVVKEASFLKDADTFGKQDPYIQFQYKDVQLKTDVKDDAGKHAKWDETFQLTDIFEEYQNDCAITFEAYDKDVGSSDFLGSTDPLEFVDLVQDETVKEWSLDLYDTKGNIAGNMKLTTQLVNSKPELPIVENINENCQLEIKMKTAEFLKDEADTFGKQDPFIQFIYEGRKLKTEVQDDAGKKASFNDVFVLDNVEEQAKGASSITMEACDHDLTSCDILGEANSISIQSLCSTEDVQQFHVDIFLKYKKTGFIEFQTRYIYQLPDPPPNPQINPVSCLEITVLKASFLKDADFIGKQDPYIAFMYNQIKVRTETKDNAGKNAEWNEKFCLTDLEKEIKNNKRLFLEAYDHDISSDDLLGKTKGLSYGKLTKDEEIQQYKLNLYDTECKVAGELQIQTKFSIGPPIPFPNPDLNRNCILKIQIIDVMTHKDADTFGKQDPFIQFNYNEKTYKTKVAQNAGKHAKFNETFELKNLQKVANKPGEMLVIKAFDQDTLTSDLLGQAIPLGLAALTQDEQQHKYSLDLYNNTYKHVGMVNITAQYCFNPVDPLPEELTEMCSLEITIVKADFIKNTEFFGKMDPYIQFSQGEKVHRSKVAENAGKQAVFNQKIILPQIHSVLEQDEDLIFQAFDKDALSSEFLGESIPIAFRKYCQNYKKTRQVIELLDKKQKVGTLIIETQFVHGFRPRIVQKTVPLNHIAALAKGLSVVNHNGDKNTLTDGIKAMVQLKIEEHQRHTMNTRIQKMVRDEAKIKSRINQALRKTHFLSQIQEEKHQKFQIKEEMHKTMVMTEQLNRDKFAEEKRKQQSLVFQAKEKTYMHNKRFSQEIMDERIKIRNHINKSKYDQIQEKQQNVKRMQEEKLKARQNIIATQQATRSASYQQKIKEQMQRTMELAMGTRDMETRENQMIKNLQRTQNMESQIQQALKELMHISATDSKDESNKKVRMRVGTSSTVRGSNKKSTLLLSPLINNKFASPKFNE